MNLNDNITDSEGGIWIVSPNRTSILSIIIVLNSFASNFDKMNIE